MRLIVFRPILWPTLNRAPWMRVYPQLGLSVAIVQTRWAISRLVAGRPGRRQWLPSYFFATRWRYQRSNVLGVTMQATPFNAARPKAFARTASLRRWSSVSRRRRLPSCSRSTRFSSTRYSIVFCCPRWIHPATAMTRNCRTGAFTVGSVYGTDGAWVPDLLLSRSRRFVRETWLEIRHQTTSGSAAPTRWRVMVSTSPVGKYELRVSRASMLVPL